MCPKIADLTPSVLCSAHQLKHDIGWYAKNQDYLDFVVQVFYVDRFD